MEILKLSAFCMKIYVDFIIDSKTKLGVSAINSNAFFIGYTYSFYFLPSLKYVQYQKIQHFRETNDISCSL